MEEEEEEEVEEEVRLCGRWPRKNPQCLDGVEEHAGSDVVLVPCAVCVCVCVCLCVCVSLSLSLCHVCTCICSCGVVHHGQAAMLCY